MLGKHFACRFKDSEARIRSKAKLQRWPHSQSLVLSPLSSHVLLWVAVLWLPVLIVSYQPHWLMRDLVLQLCTAPFPTQGLPTSGAACLASSACVCAQSLPSCLTLSDPLDCGPPGSSVPEFSRQEYWSGLPCPPAGNLPNPWIEPKSPGSPALQVDSLLRSRQGGPFAVSCFPLLSSTDI